MTTRRLARGGGRRPPIAPSRITRHVQRCAGWPRCHRLAPHPHMQACQKQPYLKSLVSRGLPPRYLWRRAREVDRKLICGRDPQKPAFSPEEKRKRVQHCQLMLSKLAEQIDYLEWVIWGDCASVTCGGDGPRHIRHKGVDDGPPLENPRQRRCGWPPKLHYFLAVNARLGFVMLRFVSGSWGYDTPYTVRTCWAAGWWCLLVGRRKCR